MRLKSVLIGSAIAGTAIAVLISGASVVLSQGKSQLTPAREAEIVKDVKDTMLHVKQQFSSKHAQHEKEFGLKFEAFKREAEKEIIKRLEPHEERLKRLSVAERNREAEKILAPVKASLERKLNELRASAEPEAKRFREEVKRAADKARSELTKKHPELSNPDVVKQLEPKIR